MGADRRAGALARRSMPRARTRASPNLTEAPPGRARPSRSGSGPKAQVVVFVKEPRPGRVKTRLAREVGTVAAARWFRAQAMRVVRELGRDPRWELRLAVSPDAEGLGSRIWPAGVARQAQGRGDLGRRMARALREAPPGPVVVVGADIPALGRAQVARAFRLLGRADAVFGPAEDGGFWLVGLSRRGRVPAGLLAGARWSSPHSLADAERSLRGLRVLRADRLADVDKAADLDRLGLARP